MKKVFAIHFENTDGTDPNYANGFLYRIYDKNYRDLCDELITLISIIRKHQIEKMKKYMKYEIFPINKDLYTNKIMNVLYDYGFNEINIRFTKICPDGESYKELMIECYN
jgi:hypothetical protein